MSQSNVQLFGMGCQSRKIFLRKGCIMTLKLSPMPDRTNSSLLFTADGGIFTYLFILFLWHSQAVRPSRLKSISELESRYLCFLMVSRNTVQEIPLTINLTLGITPQIGINQNIKDNMLLLFLHSFLPELICPLAQVVHIHYPFHLYWQLYLISSNTVMSSKC